MPLESWDGVMIEIDDPFTGKHKVPGWRCNFCDRTFGTAGDPPKHECVTPDRTKGGQE